MSANGFIKVKVPKGELTKNREKGEVILDQTRIHFQQYVLAEKVAGDVPLDYRGAMMKEVNAQLQLREVIRNPKLIKELDIKQYKIELEKQGIST
mmetsp:Transcript_17932/g.12922  ORF Transcript_17932/g.12922 Transcript_17932/m.12922 type:complete len:95 (+) Transcript_17932:1075-1359(+)